ncbi:WD repeat-containing protein atcsa-1 [Coelomomyces lativittatus]|nr:WD repeat-containing protein atcsa-1 [Coelomomyces lativittatus]
MSSHLSFSSNLRLQRLGAISPSCFQDTVHIDFVKKLLPSRKIVLQRIHQARISSLTQHSVEPHLLLSADENFIALWNTDLESINKVNGYIKPLFRVRGTTSASSRSARSFSSSAMLLSLHWFRKDPGIFFSGDSDGRLRVWDTSSASSVADIPLKEPIYQIDSNPLNPIQLAVARGTNIQVPIIDISVEHVVQTLSGHKKEIRSVVWNALGREKVRWDLCSGRFHPSLLLPHGREQCYRFHYLHLMFYFLHYPALSWLTQH